MGQFFIFFIEHQGSIRKMDFMFFLLDKPHKKKRPNPKVTTWYLYVFWLAEFQFHVRMLQNSGLFFLIGNLRPQINFLYVLCFRFTFYNIHLFQFYILFNNWLFRLKSHIEKFLKLKFHFIKIDLLIYPSYTWFFLQTKSPNL